LSFLKWAGQGVTPTKVLKCMESARHPNLSEQ
jgi:hypothetical protein